MLFNQFKVLERVDASEASYYQQCREIVEHGYVSEYPLLVEQFSEELTLNECEEVIQTMIMYRSLNDSFRSIEDKSGISADRLRFPGFDGNNEGALMAFAEHLVNKQGRWAELAGKDLNSHSQKRERYGLMRERWSQSTDSNYLTKADLLRILAD